MRRRVFSRKSIRVPEMSVLAQKGVSRLAPPAVGPVPEAVGLTPPAIGRARPAIGPGAEQARGSEPSAWIPPWRQRRTGAERVHE